MTALEAEGSALRSGAGAAAATSRAHEAEVASLKATVAELHAQLETAAKERDTRLAETKQFAQMRAMLQRKNAQLADVRGRLAKYVTMALLPLGGLPHCSLPFHHRLLVLVCTTGQAMPSSETEAETARSAPLTIVLSPLIPNSRERLSLATNFQV